MKKGAVIAIIIIVVLIIGGVVGFIAYNNSQNDTSTNTTNYQQKTSAGLGFEEDQSSLEKDAVQGVEIPGWEKITIEAGATKVFLSTPFYNPIGNEGKYNMTFELQVNGETLYQSKLVKPGDQIKEITLSKPLEAGTYNAVLHVQPYKADTGVATNNADVKFTLVVQ